MIQALMDLHNLHRVFDRDAGLLEKTTGVPICISGCGKCCQQNTPFCMTLEAINMVSVFSADRTLEKAVEEAHGWLLEAHDLKIFRGIPHGVLAPDLTEEYHSLEKSQCPFLQTDSRCLIHSQRPFPCRTFGVYRDTEGSGCGRPPGKGETLTQRQVVNGEPVRQVMRAWQAELKSWNPSWVIRAFTPSLLFKVARPKQFEAYVRENKIASAKLIGTDLDTSIMYQSQLDSLRRGVDPIKMIELEMINSS